RDALYTIGFWSPTETTMKEELQVGILGYGVIGRLHFRAFDRCQGTKVVGVSEAQQDRMSDLPPSVKKLSSYEDLLCSSVDAVSICLPTHLHHKAALQALASGKHVLLEKPIALNM